MQDREMSGIEIRDVKDTKNKLKKKVLKKGEAHKPI